MVDATAAIDKLFFKTTGILLLLASMCQAVVAVVSSIL